MCSRYRSAKEAITVIINGRKVKVFPPIKFNVAPSSRMPVIVETDTGYTATEMSWGWQPAWSAKPLINGQSETINEKPTFRRYIHQRCLIPADGFYEWTPDKQPIMFTRPDDAPFCFAGLYMQTTTQTEDLPVTESKFIILTTKPTATVAKFHDRMPLIVSEGHYGWWLDCASKSELWQSVINFPDDCTLNYLPVQRALNNVRNEGSELIRPAVRQADLF